MLFMSLVYSKQSVVQQLENIAKAASLVTNFVIDAYFRITELFAFLIPAIE